MVGLRCDQLTFTTAAHIRCHGKGRKERCTPLTRQAVAALRSWLRESQATGSDLIFPSRRDGVLSRDAVERLVTKYTAIARRACPSLRGKTISPHVLRHTTAVQLLQAGVDRSTIALWLGHESVETTQMYLHADLAIKEVALARTDPYRLGPRRYKPNDRLLAFLASL